MLISKHFDPVLGIDIHILAIPPAGPIPIPHPHIALIFDVIDYVPILGATVKVGGLPRSTAGTAGRPIPHIPMGGPFVKPPMNEDEIFMGSLTVLADGGPLSYTALPTLSCHDIGLIAPPRKKKPKKSFGMVLPTSVVIAIPLGMPVMVGGGPTIDMMGLAMMGGFAALGGAFKKLRKMQKKSKRIKKMSDAIHKRAKKAMDKLGVPPNVRNKVHKGICTVTGHPVDVATGKMFTDHIDFSLPGPLPFVWERTWYSTSIYDGPLGHGWHHSYDVKLCELDNAVAVRLADGRSVAFPALDINETCFDRQERMTLFRDDNGYALDTQDKQRYRFTPFNGQQDNQLLTSLAQTTSGAEIKFYYNNKGQLSQIIDSGGRLIQLSYTDDNRIHKIFLPEPESNVTRDHTNPTLFCAVEHHYRDGMLVQVDDAIQQPLRYHYDHTLLIKETFRSGLSFYFEYDGLDHNARCLRTWGDEGIYYREIRYDLERNITYVKNSLGYVTTYYHNGVLPHRVVDPLNHASLTEYNEYSEIVCETNELGYKTRYEYDSSGNKTKIIGADGSNIQMIFDDNQNLIESIDQIGNHWKYEYNKQNLLIAKINPLNHVIRYKYTGCMLSEVIDPASNQLHFFYDQNFNLRSVTENHAAQLSLEYDALGNLLIAEDNRKNRRRRYYDKLGRLIKIEEPDGNIRLFAYDGGDNIVRTKDEHVDAFFEYSGMGRLISRTQANATIKFKYDQEEQLTAIVNEQGRVYTLLRNAKGEVITESGFDGLSRSFIKDPIGRTVRITRPSQGYSIYIYDTNNQITKTLNSDGTFTTYEYRKDGELIQATNQSTTLRWELDPLGRIRKEYQGDFWVASEYDNLGYRVCVQSSLGLDQSIERNQRGEVLRVSAGQSFETTFNRDHQGLEIQRNLPGGIQSRWTRDSLGRPIRHEIIHRNKISTSKTYLWGLNNRLLKLIDNFQRETIFQHDALNNLLSARYSNENVDLRIPDSVGNIFKSYIQKDREYGPAGQLLAIHANNGTTHYSYDLDGNRISKQERNNKRWRYEWNGNGMLSKVIRPDGREVTFEYDALGRRVRKTFDNKITIWVWDGKNPLHEWIEQTPIAAHTQSIAQQHIIAENIRADRQEQLASIPGSHAPPSFNEGTRDKPITWLFEPEGFAPIAKLVGDDSYSIISDELGSPGIIFDKNGNQVWCSEIDIWGNLRQLQGDANFCPFRFPGQYEDSETGLYYNRFRYYDPEAGQYISQDLIRLEGGMNLYGYPGDPLTWMDPFGLSDSTKLDKAINGAVGDRLQAHHVIPVEVWKRHQSFLDDIGIGDQMNANFNGIHMPDSIKARSDDAGKGMKTIHRGSHPAYSRTVDSLVTSVSDRYRAGQIDKKGARREIRKIQIEMKNRIWQGNVPTNACGKMN